MLAKLLAYFSRSARSSDVVFLLVLLTASVALNVYLGVKSRDIRLSLSSFEEANRADALKPGTQISAFKAISAEGILRTVNFDADLKPTVIYVFAPICKWCEVTNPLVRQIVDSKSASYSFIGISLADDKVQEYALRNGFSFPVYRNLSTETTSSLKLSATPTTILVAPGGRVIHTWVGAYIGKTHQEIEEQFGLKLPISQIPAS